VLVYSISAMRQDEGEGPVKATELLMEEHREIERVINALERAIRRLARGEEVYLRFFTGTAVFIRGFVDGCHHKKEENVLFPALIEHGLSDESGPVAVMLAEHEEGRRLAMEIRQAVERLQGGDNRKRDVVVEKASDFIKLLRQHIYKEDHVLFPMADKLIPASQQEELLLAFEPFANDESGEDLHEKYYGLAKRLENECMR
jgi:hemerythrin-like domain-containing protein